MNLELRHGPVLVGELTGVIVHQGTWFGLFQQTVTPDQGPMEQRLCGFIAFCKRWNAQLEAGGDPDDAEFGTFGDVIESPLWHTRCADGTDVEINGAPILDAYEASWNLSGCDPTPEIAARREWYRLKEHCDHAEPGDRSGRCAVGSD